MYWNYRLMKRIDDKGKSYEQENLYVTEVYFNNDGSILGWTEKETVWGENLKEVTDSLKWMSEALNKPILDEAALLAEFERAREAGEHGTMEYEVFDSADDLLAELDTKTEESRNLDSEETIESPNPWEQEE